MDMGLFFRCLWVGREDLRVEKGDETLYKDWGMGRDKRMACHAVKRTQSLTFQRLYGNKSGLCILITHSLPQNHSHALTADCCRVQEVFF